MIPQTYVIPLPPPARPVSRPWRRIRISFRLALRRILRGEAAKNGPPAKPNPIRWMV
jgi:hypothetical protein